MRTRINGFQFGHLFVKQFYWLFWFAIRYHITGKTGLMCGNGGAISVGDAYPVDSLWDAGWRVSCGGYVLGRPIIVYERPGMINPFSFQLPKERWMEYGTSTVSL